MECAFHDLDFVLEDILLDEALRTKVKIRYRDLLEKNLALPLWTTYYNTQIKRWIEQTYPKLNTPPDLSASSIVRYLVETYAMLTGDKFLFHETNRDDLAVSLKPLKTKNYLLKYLADEMETRLPLAIGDRSEAAAEPRSGDDTCRPKLFEEVSSLIDRCLKTPAGRRPVEEALFVVSLPEQVKREFNQQFLQDLRTQYTKKKTLSDDLLSQIETLDETFFQTYEPGAGAYLTAAAAPLAFLNASNMLGKVSQTFKSKVRGGVFQVKDLFLAGLPHLWPELAVQSHQLSDSTFNRLHQIACDSIKHEIQTILGLPLPGPAESEEKETGSEATPKPRRGRFAPGFRGRFAPESAGWEQNLANLEQMCQTYDLKRVVFYYTGGKFVCFREDEVLHDIAQNETQKYPSGFLAKMKKRGIAPLPSPVIGAIEREELSRQESQDNRDKHKPVDFGARQNTFTELENRFGGVS